MNQKESETKTISSSVTGVAVKELKKTRSRNKATTPDANIPSGPIDSKWTKHKMDSALINPANRRKFTAFVVGSGLAGGGQRQHFLN